MEFDVLWFVLALLVPVVLLVPGLCSERWANLHVEQMSRLTHRTAWTAFLVAGVVSVHSFVSGPLGFAGLYLDPLSGVMLLLVSFLGLVVVRYTRGYLKGDPEQGRFFKWLALTLGLVLLLVSSGHLLLFWAAWVGTSLSLHQLLTFYRDRTGARLAARKKFMVSRAGDLTLLMALPLVSQVFGSLSFADIFAQARQFHQDGVVPVQLPWIAGLMVLAAILKSAQFPFHGWLPEVMETPTPVSALLHAGVVHAGGFLILRMSEVLSLVPVALEGLAVSGAVTALFGSLVMLTQPSIKVKLAYSTVAQMGFMMLQCGLGAFSAALLHIVGHSLYKAHAFLSSGGQMRSARPVQVYTEKQPPLFSLLSVLGLGVVLMVGMASLLGVTEKPALVVLGVVFALGLGHLLWLSVGQGFQVGLLMRGLGLTLLVSALYFLLQKGAQQGFADVFPVVPEFSPSFLMLFSAAVVMLFLGVTLVQALLPYRLHDPRWQLAYVQLSHGLHINTLTNLWIRRLWPVKVAVPHAPQMKGAPHDPAFSQH